MNNFIDLKTKKEFFISKFKSKFVDGQIMYLNEYGNEVVNPINGNKLTKIEPSEMSEVAVFTDTASRFSKHSKYFKDRADKHNKSRDVQRANLIKERDMLFHT